MDEEIGIGISCVDMVIGTDKIRFLFFIYMVNVLKGTQYW